MSQNEGTGHGTTARAARGRLGAGLSTRLLALTIAFVILAEILIYVPAIANFRDNWLLDRLSAARTAALVLEAAPADMIPDGLVTELLHSVGAMAIAMKIKDTRRLLALGSDLPMARASYDLRDMAPLAAVASSFDTLFNGRGRAVRVIGAAPMGGDFVEILIDETPLRAAMLRFSRNILMLSLVVLLAAAALLYLALSALIVRPVRRLAGNITAFAAQPDDAARVITPSRRGDEIGQAEQELAHMQRALMHQLGERRHLAQLGLAVSKINHDLRNMLASAQLVSDRLVSVAEPTVQRFAPKLIATLDRAIKFCESTLAYGRVQEQPPAPRPVDLTAIAAEVESLLPLGERIAWRTEIAPDLAAEADPDYLFRVLLNLARNAVQALEQEGAGLAGEAPRITLSAARENGALVLAVSDNGPGVAPAVRETLFQAFRGSGRPGSTGLGLAIAADLVRGHGGSIRLCDEKPGARFEIILPQPAAAP
jgi:signal transduction histidine kinase